MDAKTLSTLLGTSEFKAWCKARRGKWRSDLSFFKAWKAAKNGDADAQAVIDTYKVELVKLRLK